METARPSEDDWPKTRPTVSSPPLTANAALVTTSRNAASNSPPAKDANARAATAFHRGLSNAQRLPLRDPDCTRLAETRSSGPPGCLEVDASSMG